MTYCLAVVPSMSWHELKTCNSLEAMEGRLGHAINFRKTWPKCRIDVLQWMWVTVGMNSAQSRRDCIRGKETSYMHTICTIFVLITSLRALCPSVCVLINEKGYCLCVCVCGILESLLYREAFAIIAQRCQASFLLQETFWICFSFLTSLKQKIWKSPWLKTGCSLF